MNQTIENLGALPSLEDVPLLWKRLDKLIKKGCIHIKIMSVNEYLTFSKREGKHMLIRYDYYIGACEYFNYKTKKEALKAFKKWNGIGEPIL